MQRNQSKSLKKLTTVNATRLLIESLKNKLFILDEQVEDFENRLNKIEEEWGEALLRRESKTEKGTDQVYEGQIGMLKQDIRIAWAKNKIEPWRSSAKYFKVFFENFKNEDSLEADNFREFLKTTRDIACRQGDFSVDKTKELLSVNDVLLARELLYSMAEVFNQVKKLDNVKKLQDEDPYLTLNSNVAMTLPLLSNDDVEHIFSLNLGADFTANANLFINSVKELIHQFIERGGSIDQVAGFFASYLSNSTSAEVNNLKQFFKINVTGEMGIKKIISDTLGGESFNIPSQANTPNATTDLYSWLENELDKHIEEYKLANKNSRLNAIEVINSHYDSSFPKLGRTDQDVEKEVARFDQAFNKVVSPLVLKARKELIDNLPKTPHARKYLAQFDSYHENNMKAHNTEMGQYSDSLTNGGKENLKKVDSAKFKYAKLTKTLLSDAKEDELARLRSLKKLFDRTFVKNIKSVLNNILNERNAMFADVQQCNIRYANILCLLVDLQEEYNSIYKSSIVNKEVNEEDLNNSLAQAENRFAKNVRNVLHEKPAKFLRNHENEDAQFTSDLFAINQLFMSPFMTGVRQKILNPLLDSTLENNNSIAKLKRAQKTTDTDKDINLQFEIDNLTEKFDAFKGATLITLSSISDAQKSFGDEFEQAQSRVKEKVKDFSLPIKDIGSINIQYQKERILVEKNVQKSCKDALLSIDKLLSSESINKHRTNNYKNTVREIGLAIKAAFDWIKSEKLKKFVHNNLFYWVDTKSQQSARTIIQDKNQLMDDHENEVSKAEKKILRNLGKSRG